MGAQSNQGKEGVEPEEEACKVQAAKSPEDSIDAGQGSVRSSNGSSRVQEKATVEPDGVLPPLRL